VFDLVALRNKRLLFAKVDQETIKENEEKNLNPFLVH
jgi:hypothetical protein